MRGIKFALLSLLLVGCKTVEPEIRYVETEKTIYKDRIVEVESPADSANIQALLKCDEDGNVLVMQLQEESSRNASLSFKVDSLNHMIATFNTEPIRIPVEVHDTTYINKSAETKFVEVERELTRVQRFYILLGKIALLLVIGAVVYLLAVMSATDKEDIIRFIKKILGI